ncbi:MAG TPA: ComEC/Rec2 family competence protein [Hanamia sp.]
MAKSYHIFIWKKAPFVRLLLPLIAGIIFEYYFNIKISTIIFSVIILPILMLVFFFLKESKRFSFRWLQGILMSLFLVVFGLWIGWQKDIRNHQNWYGNLDENNSLLVTRIIEPPIEKAKSYKALASVESCIDGGSQRNAAGTILLYFDKDSFSKRLNYGDEIIVAKKLKDIKNSGNPAGFDYGRYMAFQQVYQQGYLKKSDWILLPNKSINPFKKTLFDTRAFVIKTIDQYIPGENESALAKALLIGYRVDLDKDLVQAYSNAGVVHIIAISGLHLGLIYGLLLWLTLKIPLLKKAKVPRVFVILFCMWFFVFLTGASPSVMRAAVMFSFISVGTILQKRVSVYNSLSASAFLLLCFDPYLLWNVGFQLSYLAVLGIVSLQKTIYNWFYVQNKILDYTWKLASVSIAAQIFTIPICFYYFHQLPLLFLLANIIVIPLATIALCGCITLIIFSPFGTFPVYLGKLVSAFLFAMNYSVRAVNHLPFLLWNNVSISVCETILLYLIFISFLTWLFKRNSMAFRMGLVFTLIFSTLIFFDKWNSSTQKTMIVYNVPMHSAIDFIDGQQSYLLADSVFVNDPLLQKYNLYPARISLNATNSSALNNPIFVSNNFYQFYDKKILVVDKSNSYVPSAKKIHLDYVVISKNPKIKIKEIAQVFDCSQYIFDGSNSLWKIEQWKKECEELHLQFHSVSEQGAFVINQ